MATAITKSFVAPPPLSERINKEDDFFAKPFLMSYSGLNRLLFSPALFYQHYILKQREDAQDQNMIEGSLIHCLLLHPDNFDNQFVLSVQDPPSDNPRKVLDTLLVHYKDLKAHGDTRTELHEFNDAILDILRDMNLYQSLKTDAQRLEKMVTSRHEEYWRYLTSMEGKIVVGQDTYDFCKAVVDKITSNPVVMDRMGYFGDSFNGITKENEKELVCAVDGLPFCLRGFIDNLVFDPQNKIIRVNDVKKTSKSLDAFTDSIEYFRYWLQAGMYAMLIQDQYLSKPEYCDWKIEFRFIVIDPYMQIAPIKVSDEKLNQWIADTKVKLEEAAYHFEKRDFSLPYQYLIHQEIEL